MNRLRQLLRQHIPTNCKKKEHMLKHAIFISYFTSWLRDVKLPKLISCKPGNLRPQPESTYEGGCARDKTPLLANLEKIRRVLGGGLSVHFEQQFSKRERP